MAPREPLVRRATDNLDAYNCYLKGRFFLNQRGEGIRKGLDAFRQALSLDPGYALAHAGLAEALSLVGFYGSAAGSEVMPAAEAAARRALELDPRLAEPHSALQIVRFWFDWDWTGSRDEFDRAMEKNPNTVSSLVTRALELGLVHGRIDEAAAAAARAIEIDPLSPYSHNALAQVLLCGGRYADAIAAAACAVELNPGMWVASRVEGLVHSLQGRHDESVALLARLLRDSDRHPWMLVHLVDACERAGRSKEAVEHARSLLALSRERYVSPSLMACAAAVVTGMDDAFAWLDRAFQEHDILPAFNYYRGAWLLKRDPRWPALMRRIGLEPAPPVGPSPH